jgi:hypothetical protein
MAGTYNSRGVLGDPKWEVARSSPRRHHSPRISSDTIAIDSLWQMDRLICLVPQGSSRNLSQRQHAEQKTVPLEAAMKVQLRGAKPTERNPHRIYRST